MKTLAIALSTILATSVAFSGTDESKSGTTDSRVGYYMGGALGWTKQDLDGINDSDADYQTLGGQVNFGYAFKMSDKFYLGPEIGWGYYGEIDVDYAYAESEYDYTFTESESDTITSTGFDLVAVAQYFVVPNINLIGKAGIIYGTTKAELDAEATFEDIYGDYDYYTDSYTEDQDDYKLFTGVGLGVDITPKVNLNVIYYHVWGDDADSDIKVLKTDSVFAGLTYRF